jgi:iron-sulfur cluster assembly protein
VSALLALTDSAVQAVKDIVSSAEVAETGGLRMVAERAGMQANLQLNVVPLPAEDDEVIEEQGARVFLETEAASLLDDKVLDASVDQNRVRSRSRTRSRSSWHCSRATTAFVHPARAQGTQPVAMRRLQPLPGRRQRGGVDPGAASSSPGFRGSLRVRYQPTVSRIASACGVGWAPKAPANFEWSSTNGCSSW